MVKINVKQKNSLLSKDEIRSKLKKCGWEKAKHSIKDGKLVIDVPDSRKKLIYFLIMVFLETNNLSLLSS